jgi:Zn-dependent membrane protease YugP
MEAINKVLEVIKNAGAYEIDFNMKSLLNTYNIAWILVFIIPLLNLATLVIIGICLLCMGIINTIKNIPEFISKTLTKFSNIEERK